MNRRPDLAVFGSGAWGTALAIAWARDGANVAIWGHPADAVEALARTRRHPRLPDSELPPSVHPISSPDEAFKAPIWISALPTQLNPKVWPTLLEQAKGARPELLIHASKGILQESYLRVSQVLEPMLGVPVGALSGPTFADEVARNNPSAIVLALPESIDDARARELQALLATQRLRVYLSRDVVGVELCGALKNVLAIAAGLVEALELGHNAKAALITRGLAEMGRLVEKLGGHAETVTGLAGMGDLFLTATGAQSRNRRFGAMVGSGHSPKAASDSMGEQVVEGVFTTDAALSLARSVGVELPITEEVSRLIQGADPLEAVARLMQRSLKSE
ncbi:MAG TPA: NAD(P)H-dependent glycerol-3-phosphate dehydrogenase [Holophaga sp.]|nr:NAD(P)H-dependent glycerol-3-phosphate dehydrogenase [Holophaga sp.]